jgi:DNA-binding IclR family transcriptional regulator
VLNQTQVVTQEGERKVLYWSSGSRIWLAAIKTTQARDEVYLVSLHQTDAREVKRKVPPDEWGKLGVA